MVLQSIFHDEHEMFRLSIRRVLERELAPRAASDRANSEISRELWAALGDAGALGMMVDTEYGGGGVRDFRYNVILGAELAAYGLAYTSSIGINTDVIAPYLCELTSDDQKKRWLPAFCRGELITAIAMTEPSTGSDLSAIRTAAKRVEGGWLLNGTKTFITNGARADLVVVATRTSNVDRRRDLSLLVVEGGMEGFARGRHLEKVGQPEADTSELFFTDVFVPDDNVLGEVGKGFAYMMERLPQERLSAAAAGVAHARNVFERTLEYVKQRKAFGRTIGSFQHSRFVLAEMATKLEVAGTFVNACVAAHVIGELDATEAAMAKYWATEVQGEVIDACVQLHGGYGYMREELVARAWVDARVTRIWAGSNEIMREIIGRSLGL